MSVKIDLDLDASGATGKIGAVAASLKGLERVANDIDIDFDADVGDITDEIEEFADALANIEVGDITFLDELDKSTKRLEEAMNGEIDLNTGSGNNGGNSSDGTIPPDLVNNLNQFGDEVDTSAPSGASADGGERANLLERTYGEHTLMGERDAGKLQNLGSNRRESNLGQNDPEFASGLAGRIGTRSGFGNDPVSMDWRRKYSDLSLDSILMGADGSDKPLTRTHIPAVDNRIQAVRDLTVSFEEALMEMDEAASNAAEDSGGWDFMDFNEEAREEVDFNDYELFEQGRDGFRSGGGGGGLLDYDGIDETLKQNREDLRSTVEDGAGGWDFTDFNSEARKEAGFTAAELEPDMGGGFRGSNSNIPDGDIFDLIGLDRDKGLFGNLSEGTDKLGSKLRRLKPTMGKYMQLMAAMVPVAVALGTQLLGVAAAMGSVAAVGGAIMGLGLLGHGETMAGSFAQAKKQVQALKREMFQMAQPTMQQFAPIQARMFDAIPEGLGGVFEEMEEFAEFENTLFQLGGSLADGMEEGVAIINENQEAISDLSKTFGNLIGSGILGFFEWLIQTASENKQLIIDLGSSLISLAVVAYNVSMAISRVVASLLPFFQWLAAASDILNNKFVIGMMTAISVGLMLMFVFTKITLGIYSFVAAIKIALTLLAALGSGGVLAGITAFFGTMLSYISATIIALYEMYGAAITAATALAATGVGALIVGGGLLAGKAAMESMTSDVPSGGGGGYGGGSIGGGGKTVYNDNRSFTINHNGGDDYASQKSLEGTVKKVGETEEAQSLPDVDTSSETSDRGNN